MISKSARRAGLLVFALATTASAHPDPQNPRRTAVVDVFEKTHAAVVNISATQIVKVRRSPSPFDLFFQGFDDLEDLLQPRERKFKSSSVGSGFVIHPSGYIVTNAHVVDRTADIKVFFDDQRSFDAEVIAMDHAHDLGLIKIEAPHELTTIKLGRSDDLMIGETVIAIGNPLGYQHTLTTGVISAKNRDLELVDDNSRQNVVYADLIQTDASINPGNSGGPLLNVVGELIGINTAIRGDAQNIGFAISVDTLKQILPLMLRAEQENRFFLGLSIDQRLKVTEVVKGSPAERAGIEPGDIIRRHNHRDVPSVYDFYFGLIDHGPGDVALLDLEHEGHQRSVRVLLQERLKPDGLKLAQLKLGVTLESLSPPLARRISKGLLITAVEPGGPAQRVGILPGDILTVLGRARVTDLEEVGQVLEDTASGKQIYVSILRREGRIIYRDATHLTVR